MKMIKKRWFLEFNEMAAAAKCPTPPRQHLRSPPEHTLHHRRFVWKNQWKIKETAAAWRGTGRCGRRQPTLQNSALAAGKPHCNVNGLCCSGVSAAARAPWRAPGRGPGPSARSSRALGAPLGPCGKCLKTIEKTNANRKVLRSPVRGAWGQLLAAVQRTTASTLKITL